MTTPCDGNCACETPCAGCVSLPPFARGLPFFAPLRAPAHAPVLGKSDEPRDEVEASEVESTHHRKGPAKQAEGEQP